MGLGSAVVASTGGGDGCDASAASSAWAVGSHIIATNTLNKTDFIGISILLLKLLQLS